MDSDAVQFGNRPARSAGGLHDPLSDLLGLSRPRASITHHLTGDGEWMVRSARSGQPAFCIVLGGRCILHIAGELPICLFAEEFVLLPATASFRITDASGLALLTGSFTLQWVDQDLLVALLPKVVHLRGAGKLPTLAELANTELRDRSWGADHMLSGLVDLMLVDALRQMTAGNVPPGLLKGLGDAKVSRALVAMHARVDEAWTMATLAIEAGLSRSAFHERFVREVGIAPLEYLRDWRMKIARHLLRVGGIPVSVVAARLGYASTSTFSAAFSAQVGVSPAAYLNQCESAGRPRCPAGAIAP